MTDRLSRRTPVRRHEAEVEAAWQDTKLAQVLYHDWEAQSYDEKWSISFDQRCIDYARDRFAAVAGTAGWPYGRSLEVGCGPGSSRSTCGSRAFSTQCDVTDISPGMVEVAQAQRRGPGLRGRRADGRRRDPAVRRRHVRRRRRARGHPPHPRRRAGLPGDAPRASSPAGGSSSAASRPGTATSWRAGCLGRPGGSLPG